MARSIRLLCGDSTLLLRRVPDGAARLVLADPPYGIGYQATTGRTVANDDAPYIWWLREAWRITAPDGSLVCFCRADVQDVFAMAIQAAGFPRPQQLVWDKVVHGMGDTARTFAPQHEVIWFSGRSRAFRFPEGRPKSVLRHSGVAGEAAARLGRSYLGMEIDRSLARQARARISRACRPPEQTRP